MKCADALDRFLDHLDGDLAGDDAPDLDEHVRTCDACRPRLAEAAALHRDLSILAVAGSRPARRAAWQPVALAASLLVCAFLLYVALRPPPATVPASAPPWGRVRTGETRTMTGDFQYTMHLAFSPDGRTLASGGWDGSVRLWDPATGAPLRILRGHDGHLRCVAWSADGKLLASAGLDRTVRLWNAETGDSLAVLRGHTDATQWVAFQPGGRLLASAGHDKVVKLWDLDSRSERATLTGHEQAVVCLSFSDDGRTLATASLDGTARLWDVASASERKSIAAGGPATRVILRGRRLIAASDRSIGVWDAETGAPLATLPGHLDRVDGLALASDGRTLASGGKDGRVKVWDLETGRELESFGHGAAAYAVAFSPDFRTLASGGHDTFIRLWGEK